VTTFSVEIESFGDDDLGPDDDALFRLLDGLTEAGGQGAVAGSGGVAGGVGATFVLDEASFDRAARTAVRMFGRACRQAGLPPPRVARVAVITSEMLTLELAQQPETYLGLAELARELGVSRQRVAELRARPDFPSPVAELASGPVWRGSTLDRFIETWDRRPGRRPNAAASGEA
jgi:hypothetical protein